MKVLVNCRQLLPRKLEGIGRFTHEVLARIISQNPQHQFILVFDRSPKDLPVYGSNARVVVLPPQARHAVFFWFWFDVRWPALVRRIKPDVIFSPDGFIPPHPKVPACIVVHDINFEHFPETHRLSNRWYYRTFFPRFVKDSALVLCVSQFGKQDLISTYGTPQSKIRVAYNGVSAHFIRAEQGDIDLFKARLTDGAPYFFYLGSIQPRKNIARLLRAFGAFQRKTGADLHLVIGGARYMNDPDLAQAEAEVAPLQRVHFTGRLNNAQAQLAMSGAFALTYVPLFEGFGLPITEAFACGTPVITSNCTSMPEVAGDAALLVDPQSVTSIADAMETLWRDEALKERLVLAGSKQLQRFNWDNTASEVWRAIGDCAAPQSTDS